MNEFETIEKYFRPLTQGHDDLKDDAAILSVPIGHELVVTSDTLNADTHFFAHAAPDMIAHKALRVNLSDLAAMGAKPYAYQLNIAFPEKPQEAWLEAFTNALLKDQKQFGVFCSGGDTTTIKGSLSISITTMGFVPQGKALRRKGAKPGDHIILTGPVGDAFIGFRVLQKKLKTENDNYFINAYYKPIPRTAHVDVLRQYANAAIDISDGLIADLGHICVASGCGARIDLSHRPFSSQAIKTNVPVEDLLTGGDDYELALVVSPDQSAALLQALTMEGLKPIKIGEFIPGKGVDVYDAENRPLPMKNTGWRHF